MERSAFRGFLTSVWLGRAAASCQGSIAGDITAVYRGSPHGFARTGLRGVGRDGRPDPGGFASFVADPGSWRVGEKSKTEMFSEL